MTKKALTTTMQPKRSYLSGRKDIHPLIRFNYLPRIFGYALFLVIFFTLYHDTPSLPLWSAIISQTVIWPHVAYLLGKLSRDPRKAEYRNMVFEAFLLGIWMNVIAFNLLPVAAFFIGGALNLMATGGVRLFLKGILAVLAGAIISGMFIGFHFTPVSSLSTAFACVFTMMAYACTISYMSFLYSKRLSNHKKSLKKAHDDIQEKLIITQQEINERKRVEKELQFAMHRAEEASREKSKFLATMSHEIRTPMNAIIGMTELALKAENLTTIQDYLSIVKDSSSHLLVIINDILDFSKIESGKLTLEQTDFNLPRLLERVTQSFRFDAEKKNLFLKLSIDPNVPEYVKGDPSRLRQILVNIIANALKFTHQGGITTTVKPAEPSGTTDSQDRQTLLFSIQDSGIGISESQKDSVFERFSQAERTSNHVYGGTGLGLSICKKIIECMDGHIWFESEENWGTTFYFRIPLDLGARPEEIPPPESVDNVTSSCKLSILLAEDHPVNIELTQIVLTDLGHEVAIAHNGVEALDMVKKGNYDLVLMDIEMPEMGGLEASTRIRSGQAGFEKSGIPIIAMTAHALDDMVQTYKDVGINHSISKPINIHTLGSTILKVLENHTEVH